MNNEPVAWIKQNPETLKAEVHFDKPAKYWATVVSNPDIPLYTHPVKEHNIGISHAIGFDDGFKAGMQRAVEMNVVKELTDEEIIEIAKDCGYANRYKFNIQFARAILRKASEK